MPPETEHWAAWAKVYPTTRWQRCWIHKTANVLNKMPKTLQPKAKAMLHEIWMAETQAEGHKALDWFLRLFQAQSAQARWRVLNGSSLLSEVIQGVKFTDGIKEFAA